MKFAKVPSPQRNALLSNKSPLLYCNIENVLRCNKGKAADTTEKMSLCGNRRRDCIGTNDLCYCNGQCYLPQQKNGLACSAGYVVCCNRHVCLVQHKDMCSDAAGEVASAKARACLLLRQRHGPEFVSKMFCPWLGKETTPDNKQSH